MPILLDEGIPILKQTIDKNIRHQDYDHVRLLAKDFKIYITGTGIKEKLKRFHGGETEQLFLQREILTVTNVADIAHSCIKPLNKVGRTPATINYSWTGKDNKFNTENKKKVNEIGNKFWAGKSVKHYLTKKMGPVDSQDPNSFLVVEFKEKVRSDNPNTEKAKPYPFEVNSTDAINYFYKNGDLLWLVALNDSLMLDEKDVVVKGEKYYFYSDENIVATQIHAKRMAKYFVENPGAIMLDSISDFTTLKSGTKYIFSTSEEDEDKKRYYEVQVFRHKMGRVPAKRFGTETDPLTDHRTCVPMINPAKSYFEDSIQTMSEFSITKRLHTFPQKWQYLPKCDKCYNGKTKDGLSACTECKGTGTVTHSSSQDIVGIKMPEELKDVVNLDMMAAYKGPPIDLVKFQKEFGFEEIRRYAQSAVYNNEVGRRRVKTATESEIDFEAVYDTIKPFADNWSDMYVFVMNCIATSIDLGNGIEITHQFPDDFQMQTVSEILDDLKKANENGAPSHIKKSITRKLTRKIYIDQPREILKFDTKDKYYPFSGKSETEVQFILANGKTTKYAATLYSHFDLIFSDLEYDFNQKRLDFYELDEKVQREALKAKVKEYIGIIDSEASGDAANEFGATGPDLTIPADLEAEAKARLKGSVGGVQGILQVQASVGLGTTTYEAGIATLMEIYGFDEEQAKRILGTPKEIEATPPAAV